jgi:hypothetical protein
MKTITGEARVFTPQDMDEGFGNFVDELSEADKPEETT